MNKPLTMLAIAALGLAAAATLSLSGCAECTRYEMKAVNYQECTSRSDTGHCRTWSYTQKMENVCVERGGNESFPTSNGQENAPTTFEVTTARIRQEVAVKLAEEARRTSDPRLRAVFEACAGAPTLPCVIDLMVRHLPLEEDLHDRADILALIAVAQAAGGDEAGALGSLELSRAELAKIENKEGLAMRMGSTAYLRGLVGVADAVLANGNPETARRLLAEAGQSLSLTDLYSRTKLRLRMVPVYERLDDPATAREVLGAARKDIIGEGFDPLWAPSAMNGILRFHIERGETAEARKIDGEIAKLVARIDREATATVERAEDPKTDTGANWALYTLLGAWYEQVFAKLAIGDIGAAREALAGFQGAKDRLSHHEGHMETALSREQTLSENIQAASDGKQPPYFVKRPDPRIEAARQLLGAGNADAFKNAIAEAITGTFEHYEYTGHRANRLLEIAELLASPEGRALSKSWAGAGG